ncbi:glycosyltransferase family 4 protein [Paraburkholderia nemoris]|uniref:glycosyltransferase family 4 protein n=1 Tax=Paraburkholderia nemoris TaxID=2793076 RepID=UPI0038BDAC4A
MIDFSNLKIAIVHDWLVTRGGAERVLEEMVQVFPHADIFAVIDFYSDADRKHIGGKRARTTFIQNLPYAKSLYRNYLPLMPLAVEQLEFKGYDIIISSSHAVAKAVLVGPDQFHASYVHSPMRYVWDLQNQYLSEANLKKGLKSLIARWMLHRLRLWDARTACGVDAFIANSDYIGRRIDKVYRRKSTVIYPPVDTDAFALRQEKEEFYLTASRLVPYKKVPAIVDAFRQMPDKKLVVVGAGPDLHRLAEIPAPNVEILGHQSFSSLISLMQRAKAFVFNAEEDFGIVAVEAQACGTPVIAFGRGGVTESVRSIGREKPTGLFYKGQDAESIISGVLEFESMSSYFSPVNCRENSLKFSKDVFRKKLIRFVADSYGDFIKATEPTDTFLPNIVPELLEISANAGRGVIVE